MRARFIVIALIIIVCRARLGEVEFALVGAPEFDPGRGSCAIVAAVELGRPRRKNEERDAEIPHPLPSGSLVVDVAAGVRDHYVLRERGQGCASLDGTGIVLGEFKAMVE